MNENALYDNLKAIIEINLKDNKLDCFEAVANDKLDKVLAYNDLEEGLSNYMLNIEMGNRSDISKNNTERIKKALGLKNVFEEKEFFTKLFMRDYQSKYDDKFKLKDNSNLSKVFSDFASEELQSDMEFINIIVSLDGKYIENMNDNIKSNRRIALAAIKNDTSSDIVSFKSTTDNIKKDAFFAGEYFKKLKENNLYLNPFNIYNDIFKKDDNDLFPTKVFKNNEQENWLRSKNFIVTIAGLDFQFVKYITDGKISLTSNIEKENINSEKRRNI